MKVPSTVTITLPGDRETFFRIMTEKFQYDRALRPEDERALFRSIPEDEPLPAMVSLGLDTPNYVGEDCYLVPGKVWTGGEWQGLSDVIHVHAFNRTNGTLFIRLTAWHIVLYGLDWWIHLLDAISEVWPECEQTLLEQFEAELDELPQMVDEDALEALPDDGALVEVEDETAQGGYYPPLSDEEWELIKQAAPAAKNHRSVIDDWREGADRVSIAKRNSLAKETVSVYISTWRTAVIEHYGEDRGRQLIPKDEDRKNC